MNNNQYFSKYQSLSKPTKIIIIASLFVLFATTLELVVIADHSTLTKTFSSGPNQMISFRDISNTDAGNSTISGVTSPTQVAITVNDIDADVDITALDVVLSSATSTTSGSVSATTTLTETGVNTGEFTGTITLSRSTTTSGSTLEANPGDDIRLFYEPHPGSGVGQEFKTTGDPGIFARAKATVDLSSGGDVTLSDKRLDNVGGLCFRPITHAVKLEFANGASQTTNTDIEMIMSYANGKFVPGDSVGNLQMYYKKVSQGWDVITLSADIDSHDFFAKTVTSDPATAGFGGGDVTEGQYTLGFDVGCGGGGGGGLVRPSLVVNALVGLSAAGGGGSGPPGPTITLGALALYDSAVERISMPQEIRDMALNYDPHIPQEPVIDTYEDYDLPFSFMGYGFVLGGYETTIETQIIELGVPIEFVVVYYTNSEIAHSELNFNLGPTRTIAGSDTQVLLNIDKPPEIVDPNGNIASFTGSINNEGDLKRVATFLVTFSETAELPNPDIVIRSWTTNLSSGDTIVYDAIKIAQPEIVEIADEDIPEPEIQTLKSQYVPIWIKNNAAWWSQELIEDSDFVAGIEYLIQNEIITIQDDQAIAASYSSNKIPVWIKSNAGWWSEDLITEKEFIDGLQWLISNGIIQVTET